MSNDSTQSIWDNLNNISNSKEGLKYIENLKNSNPNITLSDFFNSYIAKHPEFTINQICVDSGLDRTFGHQIINGRRKGSRDRIIALCYAAKMDVEETNHALTHSGNSNLYPKTNRDAFIILCFRLMKKGEPGYNTVNDLNNKLAEGGYDILATGKID